MLLKLSCLNTSHIIFIADIILLLQAQTKVIHIKFWGLTSAVLKITDLC